MAKKKPGKYDAVVKELAPRPPDDPSRQERLETIKKLLLVQNNGDLSANDLADSYALARRRLAEIETAAYNIGLVIEALTQMLCASQDAGAEGWGQYGVADNAIRLPDGSTIRHQREPYGKVTDKEAFRKWCIANGYENQLQLWPTTMNAITKERLVKGEPEPDGVTAYSYSKLVFEDATKKTRPTEENAEIEVEAL